MHDLTGCWQTELAFQVWVASWISDSHSGTHFSHVVASAACLNHSGVSHLAILPSSFWTPNWDSTRSGSTWSRVIILSWRFRKLIYLTVSRLEIREALTFNTQTPTCAPWCLRAQASLWLPLDPTIQLRGGSGASTHQTIHYQYQFAANRRTSVTTPLVVMGNSFKTVLFH